MPAQLTPQVEGSARLTSHPLATSVSQWAYAPAQLLMLHAPLEQFTLLTLGSPLQSTMPEQSTPQVAVAFRLVSHPLETSASQWPYPVAQALMTQVPAAHPTL